MLAPRHDKPLALDHMVDPREQPCPQGEKVLTYFKEQPFPSGRKGVMLLQGIIMLLEEHICLKFCMIVIFSYEF
jgi:hypothetical protein